jgi:protein-tyrosine phosphatase
MIDLHCHVLPSLDDGAGDIVVSESMLGQAAASGIKEIVATPHVGPDTAEEYYKNMLEKYEILKGRAEKYHIKLHLGAEIFHSPVILKQLEKWPELFLDNKDKYILLEASFLQKPHGLKEIIFELNLRGIKVVIAHPERYFWLADDEDILDYMIHSGVIFQLDAGSLTGSFSRKVMKFGWEMIEKGIAHYVASDAHNVGGRSFNELLKAREFVFRNRGKEVSELLFNRNPSAVLNGDADIPPVPPGERREKLMDIISGFLR